MRKNLLTSYSSFRSIQNFTLKSNHLSIEACDSVGSSKLLQWREWSHTACVSSEIPDTRKTGKKVPKHERRAMVESFVNKYRSENAGKFPTIQYAKKEVGGSYYVVREIIQELEYKCKMKSLNSMDERLVEKLFDESKLRTAESVNVSSCNIETAKDRLIQDDSQLVVLDDKETVNTGHELLEGKGRPQTSSWEGRLSNEVELISKPDNHCITSESNILEKHFEEPSSKIEEVVSTFSDSVALESQLLLVEAEHVSTTSSENYGAVNDKTRGHGSEFVDMENHQKMEEAISSVSDSLALESQLLLVEAEHFSTTSSGNYGAVNDKTRGHGAEFVDMENHKMEEKCIEKESYERREQPALEDMSGEASHSSPQVQNNVKSVEAVSSCPSDFVAAERHLLKEEIDQVSAPIVETSGRSNSKDPIHRSKFVDIEKHPTSEINSFEKAGFERKAQDGVQDLSVVDSPKNKKEQPLGSLNLDESKIDSSTKRESSVAVTSDKSTLWGNLKSFADGIVNIWRKL